MLLLALDPNVRAIQAVSADEDRVVQPSLAMKEVRLGILSPVVSHKNETVLWALHRSAANLLQLFEIETRVQQTIVASLWMIK